MRDQQAMTQLAHEDPSGGFRSEQGDILPARAIQLPQAITAILPALVGQLVVILKDSALGAIITYPELLRQARNLAAGGNTLQPLVVAALIFIVLNFSLTTFAGYLERRINRRGKVAGGAAPVDEAGPQPAGGV